MKTIRKTNHHLNPFKLSCKQFKMRLKVIFLLTLFIYPIITKAQSIFCLEKPVVPNTITIQTNINVLPYRDVFYPTINCYYGINNWAETGLFLGFFQEKDTQLSPDQDVYFDRFIIIGADAKVHVINLFFPQFRLIDIYMSVKPYFGFEREYIPDLCLNKIYTGPFFNIYSGLAINIFHHFGFMYEYGILQGGTTGKHKDFKLGLYYRFGGPKKWQR